jgi:hypothetical protein
MINSQNWKSDSPDGKLNFRDRQAMGSANLAFFFEWKAERERWIGFHFGMLLADSCDSGHVIGVTFLMPRITAGSDL